MEDFKKLDKNLKAQRKAWYEKLMGAYYFADRVQAN